MLLVDYSDYFSKIEETFQKCRRNSIPLSPLDWILVESWFARGIPLHIIVDSIKEAFSNVDIKRRRKINSLRYFKYQVERKFKGWRSINPKQEREYNANAEISTKTLVINHLDEKIKNLQQCVQDLSNAILKKRAEDMLLRLITLRREIYMLEELKDYNEALQAGYLSGNSLVEGSNARSEDEESSDAENIGLNVISTESVNNANQIKSLVLFRTIDDPSLSAEKSHSNEKQKKDRKSIDLEELKEEDRNDIKIEIQPIIKHQRIGILEKYLEKLDKSMDSALLRAADCDILIKCRRKAEEQMKKNKSKVSSVVFKRNQQLLLLKLLREEYKIPKLGLFEL
ncbi:MAG: hypothetical protein D6735_02470 [Acidobacteria bacterium]|nr:MAG: hypothetical protein D6735_02470 [Acidobacteriota bacterium]